jgi:hypothetical protein
MFKLIDLQGDNGFSLTKRLYKTKKQIIKVLTDFHDIDFTGCIDKKGKEVEVSLYDYLKRFKTIKKKLDYLLDYGQWEVKRIKNKKLC